MGILKGRLIYINIPEILKRSFRSFDEGRTYLVYCRDCTPSYPCSINPPGAAAVMRNLNFEKVYNMGGIIQWQEEGYPLVK